MHIPANPRATNHPTPRQLQLLKLVASSQNQRGYCPTIAELARELGISRSTVYEHIAEARRKRLLYAHPGRARSLKLTPEAQELLSRIQDRCHPTTLHAQARSIPLAGLVAAGQPIEAVENIEYLSLESCFGIDDETFALQVRGESMIEAGIQPGDYVICRRCRTAENGQLVVALLDDGNATLKKFYKEKARVRLEPANSEYEPIFSSNCRIEAVVVGLLRKL